MGNVDKNEFSPWNLCESLARLYRFTISVMGRQGQEVPRALCSSREAHLVSSRPVRDTAAETRYTVWRMIPEVDF